MEFHFIEYSSLAGSDTIRRSEAHSYQMDFRTFPNEIWICIFESMTRPSELFRVIQTSKQFYTLAIRVLYRNVRWGSPFDYIHNSRFWGRQTTAMTQVPISLAVGISHIHAAFFGRFDPTVAIVDEEGTWEILEPSQFGTPSAYDAKALTFFASPTLFEAISSRISTFTMLEELIFYHATLPPIIYSIIHSLPRLKRLCIKYCFLPPSRIDSHSAFVSLPITELTLLCGRGSIDVQPDSDYVAALLLATASNLRTLRVDWTSVSAAFFAQQNPALQYELPTKLEILELRMPTAKFWLSNADAASRWLIDPLCLFLIKCPNILQFRVVNHLPSLCLQQTTLPNLQLYSGPLSTVRAALEGRPVQHLEISVDNRRVEELKNMLPELANLQPNLRVLLLSLPRWDNEILYPITEQFTHLRELQIKYHEGHPTEYDLLSLGSRFLFRLSDLHTLRMYNCVVPTARQRPKAFINGEGDSDSGPNGGNIFDELKELIAAWRKHCLNLREIQLVGKFVWRRAFDGDDWSLRALE